MNLREVDNVYLKGCRLHKNAESMDGGAVSLDGIYNQIDIRDTKFTSNEATGRQESSGGALAVGVFSRMTVKRTDFRNNKASHSGGALNLPTTAKELSRTLDMALSTFATNTALQGSGGNIYFEARSIGFNGSELCAFRNLHICLWTIAVLNPAVPLSKEAILIKTGDWCPP